MKNESNIPGHINIGIILLSAQTANVIADLKEKGIEFGMSSNGLIISYTSKATKADLRKARQIIKRSSYADFWNWEGTKYYTPFEPYRISNLVWCRKNLR